MPRNTIIDIHDEARGGEISRLIHSWRADGLSVNEVAFRLRGEGIHIDPKTLTRWLKKQQEVAS